MREIKFRAWDQENNQMINWYDTFFYDDSPVTRYSGDFSYIEMPLMQYTGLKDKNEVEIYEGDIIRSYNEFGEAFEQLSVVEYDVSTGQLKGIDIKYIDYEEVIGNIYENPDLIKRKI